MRSQRYGVYIKQNSAPMVKDIGRDWMIKSGYRKAGNKAWFDQWEKKE